MKQNEAFKILSSGHNVLLTGAAGSGKTFLLNRYINSLKEQGIAVAVTVSTGIAATHLNGRTIHSWSGIGIKDSLTRSDLNNISRKAYLRKQFENTEVLVIDEVSMLSAHHLDMINSVCQTMKRNILPFGGMQVILSGDFFQLPPINRGNEEVKFIKQAEIWPEMDIRVCYLTEQHRQGDDELVSLLTNLRSNSLDEKGLAILKSKMTDNITENISAKVTKLFTHNADVDRINKLELDKIQAEERSYQMSSEGEKNLVAVLEKHCLAPKYLSLKTGALVMFVKNKFVNEAAVYVNGSIGLVIGFNYNGFPRVRLHNGRIIDVMPDSWRISDNDDEENILAQINQLPLRLAWAITVHKSQGMTLDEAVIDLGQSFSYGMGYVALSRLKSLKGLHLLGLNEMACQVDPKVLEYDKELRNLSQEAKKNKKSTWRKEQGSLAGLKSF